MFSIDGGWPMRTEILYSPEDVDLFRVPHHITAKGYVRGWIFGESNPRMLHRVVVERMLGRRLDRDELCDHINRIRTDNRRANLRVVSIQQNNQNRGIESSSESGCRGVYRDRRRKRRQWRVMVTFNNKQYCGGSYATVGEAACAARELRARLGVFGEENYPKISPESD